MSSGNGPVIAFAAGAVVILGLFVFAVYNSLAANPLVGGKPEPAGQCISSPVPADMRPEGVEFVKCASQTHVPDTQRVKYNTDPPLSGAHFAGWVTPGFYRVAQTPERLVHSLEHGNVVIYYDKARMTDAELEEIRKIATTHKEEFAGVIAVPREDKKHAVILTAWEHALRLEKFDQARIDQFVDVFRGRGPENPVR